MPDDIWFDGTRTWRVSEGGREVIHHHRLMSFRKPLAPWRETLREAEADAIELAVGRRYADRGVLYLTVPAWIWTCDPTPVTWAGLRPRDRHRDRLVQVADFTRQGRRSASAAERPDVPVSRPD